MRAMIVALGLAAGLVGTAGEARAQWVYPNYGYVGYNPYAYGQGRGPFVGGRYLAAPVYGFNNIGYGAYNYGAFNPVYNGGFGYPGVGFGGYPGFGAYNYNAGYRFNYSYGSYGGFRY